MLSVGTTFAEGSAESSVNESSAVVLSAGKSTTKTFGKKHHSGLWSLGWEVNAGDSFGFSINKKDKDVYLTDVGFYTEEFPDMLDSLQLQLNIYDMKDVKGKRSDKFVKVSKEPIIIQYTKDQVVDNKFTYKLSEPILLPESVFVELVMMQDSPKKIVYKGNVVGGKEWVRMSGKPQWVKVPFALPGFAICEIYKQA